MRFLILTTIIHFSLLAPGLAVNFGGVTILSVESGEEFTSALPGIYRFNGQYLKVHIRGIEVPQFSAACEKERILAGLLMDVLNEILSEANRVDLLDVERWKYTWVIATVKADGVDVAELLIQRGFARLYAGGTREGWCN